MQIHTQITQSFLQLTFGVSLPYTDLSVRVQTASRAPFVFTFQVFDQERHERKQDNWACDRCRRARIIESTGRNIWRPPWGTI